MGVLCGALAAALTTVMEQWPIITAAEQIVDFSAWWHHVLKRLALHGVSMTFVSAICLGVWAYIIKKGSKMKMELYIVSLILLATNAGFAQTTNYPQAKVSFDDFKGLVAEVETHRASRLIDLNTFLKMSKEPGVLVLDSRSAFRFDRIHVKGATHLAFTDFTQDNLKKVIPSYETTILIYCNNNFDGNQTDFASKVALPRPKPPSAVASQFASQAKPLMMALYIPTYINLYGYGYRNVYELHELVKVNDPRIEFEESIVGQKSAPPVTN